MSMNNHERYELALEMVSTLPRWGQWATGFRDFETPYGKVGYRQLAILWALRYEHIPPSEFSPSRVAQFHEVQPSVVTRALARLEANGFIERVADPSDGRSYRVHLTERGREVSMYVERLYTDDIMSSFSFLDEEQLEHMRFCVNALGRIIEDLEVKRRKRTYGRDVGLHDDVTAGEPAPS